MVFCAIFFDCPEDIPDGNLSTSDWKPLPPTQQERMSRGEARLFKSTREFQGAFKPFTYVKKMDQWPEVSLFMSKGRECWLVKEMEMPKKKNPVKKETPKAKKVLKKPSAKKA